MTFSRAHDPLVGRALGGFVVRERIGEGGFGAVYRATQAALDREAVIKVLHGRLHASKAAAERFLREAKLASKLDHPYAAHIYGFGAEPDGELWIAMELVRGTPLDQVLGVQKRISLERFVPLLSRICEVVHTAHEQGIVHRDLKPANVMVLARAGRWLPKLLDFGIAKGLGGERAETSDPAEAPPLDADLENASTLGAAPHQTARDTANDGALTQRGAVMGSPHYMAPEQWLDAGGVDGRTDLYALGVLAYECVTGKPPFVGKSITDIAREHALKDIPSLGAGFPPALDGVFAKVLAKEPAGRYPDVLAFLAAFRQAAGISDEPARLPTIDPVRRDQLMATAPQPIAEAVAALDAARNAFQARGAARQLAHTVARYLGVLALACRSRVMSADESPAAVEAVRSLFLRAYNDREWLELGTLLTEAWIRRRDAYPVPELVDLFHGERSIVPALERLYAACEREATSEQAQLELLERAVGHANEVLASLAFLADYPLVIAVPGGVAERWMGVRRSPRTTTPVHGKGLAEGVPALLDQGGAPVLVLAPLVQAAAPTPGAPLELFWFEGRDARGAKLVALPGDFACHDDDLWDWFRAQLADSIDETDPSTLEERMPYRGLSAFSAEDGSLFFGREEQIDAFVNRLKIAPLLAVVGRSGAGKSSFVHAGVVPALGWRAIAMRPGPAPLAALVARLEHAKVGTAAERAAVAQDREALGALLRTDAAARGPVLLVVDQLEEMFTLCSDGEEQRAFAEAVALAARSADDPVRVVFTLRDDFLVRTEQVPALRNRIGQGLQLLTVPIAEDLRRILVEPAKRAGYELEEGLAADMVDEVAGQPGALALLSFAAAKLWELRDRHFRQLTRAAYKTLGGVGGALARHADVTIDAMRPDERALTREAFRHLVTTQNTRAVVARAELCQMLGGAAAAEAVLEKLVAARLLVAAENDAGTETIEIVHEALLVTWPRLADWRSEDSEGARFREQLKIAAGQWDERARARGLLWRGDALAELTRWRARHPGPLSDREAAFAAASLAEAARGRRNRRVLLASAFAVLVAGLVGLGVFNTRIAGQRARAESERERAETLAGNLHGNVQAQFEDQGRRLVLANDPQQALAYLAKAAEYGARGPEHDFLVAQAVQALSGEALELHIDNEVETASFSHDGKRLLIGGFDHKTRVFDASTAKQLLEITQGEIVTDAAFSPDDATLVTGGADGLALLVDAHTGQVLHQMKHPGVVTCARFAPDGKRVLSAAADAVVWSVPDGAERFRLAIGDHEQIKACAFSADGGELALAAGPRVRVYAARDGHLVRELLAAGAEVTSLVFSPDGARVVGGTSEGSALQWAVADGRVLHTFSHTAAVTAVDITPDGRSILTGSRDRTAVIWDADTGARRLTLTGHSASVLRARFSPDGHHVVTTSEEGTAWLWDAGSGLVLARWRGHQGDVGVAAFDGAGKRLVTGGADGRAVVWNVAPQAQVAWLPSHRGQIGDARFSPDGTRVITASYDGTVRLSDASTLAEILHLSVPDGGFSAASFSPDSTRIATHATTGEIQIWDAASGREVTTLTKNAKGQSGTVEWSPDGRMLVSAASDMLRGWDVATGTSRFEVRAHDGFAMWSASFDPSGTRIVTTGDDLKARLWDVNGQPAGVRAHPDGLISAYFDRSGRRLASVTSQQRAKVWDAETGKTVVELVGHSGHVTDARWAPNDRWVITGSTDRTARIWSAATGDQLAVLPFPGEVLAASFSPDGKRVVIAGISQAAIYTLPIMPPAGDELARILRCRVPFEVQNDHLESRPTRCAD